MKSYHLNIRPVWGAAVSLVLACAGVASCSDEIDHGEDSFGYSRDIAFTIRPGEDGMDGARSALPADSILSKILLDTSEDSMKLVMEVTPGSPLFDSINSVPASRSASSDFAAAYGTIGFGVLAYSYAGAWKANTYAPGLMYNTRIIQSSGTWVPVSQSVSWPGSGNVKFLAYAPYSENAVLSGQDSKADATLGYTVLADGANVNLSVAAYTCSGSANTTVPLSFTPVFTTLKFTTAAALKINVQSVEISGVYNKGTYTFQKGWAIDTSSKTTYSRSVSSNSLSNLKLLLLPQLVPEGAMISLKYTEGTSTAVKTMYANIKGNLWPEGKTVTYRISASSVEKEYTLEVTGVDTYSYQGATGDFTVESYSISKSGAKEAAAWTATFSEDGKTFTANSPAWLTNFTKSANAIKTAFKPVVAAAVAHVPPCDAQLEANKGILKSNYNLGTNGGTTPLTTANCYVVNYPGTYKLPLVYGNAIKNGKTNFSAYKTTVSRGSGGDVLTQFVRHDGKPITNPIIKYNFSNEQENLPTKAKLIWSDAPGLITVTEDVISSSYTVDGAAPGVGDLIFTVDATKLTAANAIVAVCSAGGTVLWSWHIWVTGYELGKDLQTVTNQSGGRSEFLPFNLGWCDGESKVYDERFVWVKFTQDGGREAVVKITQMPYAEHEKGNQPYYQFGRKDPMLPAQRVAKTSTSNNAANNNKDHEGNFISESSQATIGQSIQNPGTFYSGTTTQTVWWKWWDWTSWKDSWGVKWDQYVDWCSTTYSNLWSANCNSDALASQTVVKTVYDPSPAGYRLPASDAWTGFTASGTVVTFDAQSSDAIYDNSVNSPYVLSATGVSDYVSNYGWEFYCNPQGTNGEFNKNGGITFYPTTGFRYSAAGTEGYWFWGYPANYWWCKYPMWQMFGCGSAWKPAENNPGYYWSAIPGVDEGTNHKGRSLSFSRGYVAPDDQTPRSLGHAVRPVKE